MKALLRNTLLACGLSAALPAGAVSLIHGFYDYGGSRYTFEIGDTTASSGAGIGNTWSFWSNNLPTSGDPRYLAIISSYDEYSFVRGIVVSAYADYVALIQSGLTNPSDPTEVLPYFAFGNGTYPVQFVLPPPATAPNNTFDPWITPPISSDLASYGALFSADCSIPTAITPSSAGCGPSDPSWVNGVVNLMSYAIYEEDIPAPATLALIGLGMLGLGASRRRRS